MLRGPVGRSGEDAEDDIASERLGLGVRSSCPEFADFLVRGILDMKRMELKTTKDQHEGGE